LLRPGRFDGFVETPFPDDKTRLEIFKVHTKRMPLAKDVDLKEINEKTKGYSGADIEGVCREAGMNAIRADKDKVSMEDFEKAVPEVKASVTKENMERIKKFEEGAGTAYR
jgi:transitional endoplasmic reticulum ATPase